jgi:tRNA1Val (adenine37-N6)-methyltransferase
MPGGNTFAFKHFKIVQDKCAMKVGTDAVLLGAWASCTNYSSNILDIGTGTGVIALMMAQKYPKAIVDAIDIDRNAYIQACENVKDSPWKDNITIYESSLQEFNVQKKYNIIISNPPYFINSSKTPHESRTAARHNDLLPFEELVNGVVKLLDKKGCFFLILPQKEGEYFIAIAESQQLFLNKLTKVKTKINMPNSKRLLMQFGFEKVIYIEDELVIESEDRHQYSVEYKNLTKDFYLNF